MATMYELGPRVLLPAFIGPHAPRAGEPAKRPLWIYASDPANVGLREPVLRIEVPFEPLDAGPVGAVFAVATEALPDDLVKAMDWREERAQEYAREPLDLNQLSLALDAGLRPTTGDLRFAAQMVYAVCQQVYGVFQSALGRNPTWGPWAADRLQRKESARLLLKPFSLSDSNAFYDPGEGMLKFGYFRAHETTSPYVLPGGLVFVALSHDIIAHELTHAVLDGLRAEFILDTHVDVPAFHEGFADLIALLTHFSQESLVEQALDESRGDLDSDLLFDLGKQFGEAINSETGGALRRALMRREGPDTPADKLAKYDDPSLKEAHDRGSILVSAVFEALLAVYQRRTRPLFRIARLTGARHGGELSAELVSLLAEEAGKVAEHFMRICVRAIDYCPPVDIRFGEYLRAMVTADYDAVPSDPFGYRDALVKAFRRREIRIEHVQDLSEDSLRWGGPDLEQGVIPELSFSRLRFTDDGVNRSEASEIERRARALGEFVCTPSRLRVFGLHEPVPPYEPIVIESIRLAHRSTPDGLTRNELVAEVTQTRRKGRNAFIGGATILIGNDGAIRYVVRKRVDDAGRRRSEMDRAGPSGAKRLDFRALHKARWDAEPRVARDGHGSGRGRVAARRRD